MSTAADPTLTRPVLTRLNDDGSFSAQSCTSTSDSKIRALCLVPSRLVVPVIFVPGIMGTRLRVKSRTDQMAWFPPEGKWEGLMQVLGNVNVNAAARQKLLNPETTEVDNNGVAHPDEASAVLLGDAPGHTDAERGKWRGWGQLHADSYAEILSVLEQRLAHILVQGENKEPQWRRAVMDWQEDKAKLGAQSPLAALDDKALTVSASVFYPVHAVGYNWLQSNKASGEHLAKEIDRILGHYASRKMVAEKVILVTHSMGGLVARACFQLPGMQDKIMGIVHGVMPAIGAPASYKRMRAGFEGIESVILGRDAAEATAVMANAPGPLELLPTAQYQTKLTDGSQRHWLRASHLGTSQRGMSEQADTLLGNGADPYTSIYLNNHESSWWRLVKEALIDPAGRAERERAKKEAQKAGKRGVEENNRQSDFEKFKLVMEKAKELQDFIKDKYHPNTYAYYAADAGRPSWNEVHWVCPQYASGEVATAPLLHDDLNGRVMLRMGARAAQFQIAPGRGPGDGTVPAESGAAPTPFVVQMFKHEGRAKGHTSYDHQGAFNADIVQATTLYSICRMVADSPWIRANLHRV